MKLYEIKGPCRVRVLNTSEGPPDGRGFKPGDIVTFYFIDGMYSFCKDENGNVVHLKAWEDVEIVDETYSKDR